MTNEFTSKTYCELIITSDIITPDQFSEELGITPTRLFLKGEKSISKNSGSVVTKPHNLWALRSEEFVSVSESISTQINFFHLVLAEKRELLSKYKADKRMTLTFWIWIESNDGGIGLDLSSDELNYISAISNKVHFSIVKNPTL